VVLGEKCKIKCQPDLRKITDRKMNIKGLRASAWAYVRH